MNLTFITYDVFNKKLNRITDEIRVVWKPNALDSYEVAWRKLLVRYPYGTSNDLKLKLRKGKDVVKLT